MKRKTLKEIEKYIIGNENLPEYFKYLAQEKRKKGKTSEYWFRKTYETLIRLEKYFKP